MPDLHALVVAIIDPTALIIEIFGLLIIIYTIVRALYSLLFVHKLNFTKFEKETIIESGLGTALEILMVAEVMKTLTAVSIMKIAEVGLLILVRVFLSFVIHTERKHKMEEVEIELKQAEMEHKIEVSKGELHE